MYAFQPNGKSFAQSDDDTATPQLTPNILPCRIHHDGPVDSVDRFWVPVTDAKGIEGPCTHLGCILQHETIC